MSDTLQYFLYLLMVGVTYHLFVVRIGGKYPEPEEHGFSVLLGLFWPFTLTFFLGPFLVVQFGNLVRGMLPVFKSLSQCFTAEGRHEQAKLRFKRTTELQRLVEVEAERTRLEVARLLEEDCSPPRLSR